MNDRGSALPMLLVVLVGGFLALALAVEVGRFGTVRRQIGFAADVGAEAGGAMLDIEAAARGELLLDRHLAESVAVEAARAAQPASGRQVVAVADGSQVCVTVTDTFRARLLSIARVADKTIAVTGCAAPARG